MDMSGLTFNGSTARLTDRMETAVFSQILTTWMRVATGKRSAIFRLLRHVIYTQPSVSKSGKHPGGDSLRL